MSSRTATADAEELKRYEAARRIMEDFNRLTPDKKRAFTDETLTTLVNMDKRKLQKMFSKLFFKKGKPTVKDLETINQLIAVFLESIKPEFRYHYASMIYKAFKQPLPANLVKELAKVRELEWLHWGVSKDVYDELYKYWEKMGFPEYDEFLETLMAGCPSGKSK